MTAPPKARPANFWRLFERAVQSLYGLTRTEARAVVTERKTWLEARSKDRADRKEGLDDDGT